MSFVAGESGADDFLIEVGVELVGVLFLVEQAQGGGGDVFFGESVGGKHLRAGSRGAEGVDADTAAIGSSVALPAGGDAGFDREARGRPRAQDAFPVTRGLPV